MESDFWKKSWPFRAHKKSTEVLKNLIHWSFICTFFFENECTDCRPAFCENWMSGKSLGFKLEICVILLQNLRYTSFHMKTDILQGFDTCISVPLNF